MVYIVIVSGQFFRSNPKAAMEGEPTPFAGLSIVMIQEPAPFFFQVSGQIRNKILNLETSWWFATHLKNIS